MSDNPNPQGKGLRPVLAFLEESRAPALMAQPKQIKQISLELFTSLFVLESDFKFKPVRGNSYWLYQKNGRFWLSPIRPDEWNERVYGRYIGECELHEDMTWSLEMCEEAAADEQLMASLEQRWASFEEAMEESETVEDALPRYQGQMPFYQRAYAFALAHSLRASMQGSGIQALTYHEAQAQLPDDSGADA
ncbi:DUF2452 domain-containing protein [Salicola sp. Rm-C-2C1-2]|uniref:DUF2452 domain-containing protein n=1 Tax=Salicola sp. Rm-C-2C1-2 TaxID=3141321 RepID=UPI0032E445DB